MRDRHGALPVAATTPSYILRRKRAPIRWEIGRKAALICSITLMSEPERVQLRRCPNPGCLNHEWDVTISGWDVCGECNSTIQVEGFIPAKESPKLGDADATAKALSFLLPTGWRLMRQEWIDGILNEKEALRIERDEVRAALADPVPPPDREVE